MRIIKILKRVGENKYLAQVDFETDITKYGNETTKERFQKKVFTVDVLEQASNIQLFTEQFKEADTQYWKKHFDYHIVEPVKGMKREVKIILRFSKLKFKHLTATFTLNLSH